MRKTHDTIDGLLAEFRGYSYSYSYGMPPSYHVTMSWADFRRMLDRFDAAHKREVDKLNSAIQATVSHSDAEIDRLRREIAEPRRLATRRNCDKFKTSWDVLKEWHEGLDTANDIVRLLNWLLAPATEKEGGAK